MSTDEMTTRSFWDAEPDATDWPPFMDGALKERIAREGPIFRVESIRDAETEYGPTWMLDVVFEDTRWTIALSHTQRRDAQLRRMQEHLTAHDPVACGLEAITGKHERGWVLTAPTAR